MFTDPLCVVVRCSGERKFSHILDGHHHVLGRFQYFHGIGVTDVQERLSVHIQNVVANLEWRKVWRHLCGRIWFPRTPRSSRFGQRVVVPLNVFVVLPSVFETICPSTVHLVPFRASV